MQNKIKIPGIILAGGKSSRMGVNNKCLLKLSNKTILQHIIDNLLPQVSEIVINTNGNFKSFKNYNLKIISDSFTDFGPLSGILASLEWGYINGFDYVLTVPSDVPFFPTDLKEKLLVNLKRENKKIIMASSFDYLEKKIVYQPTFGIWKTTLKDDLRLNLQKGLRKIFLWVKKHEFEIFQFNEKEKKFFFNINDSNDLKRIKKLMKEEL